MTVRQLSREQLNELKETYMFETVCSGPSYSDLAEACNIHDELIFEHYDGYDFVNDDFFLLRWDVSLPKRNKKPFSVFNQAQNW